MLSTAKNMKEPNLDGRLYFLHEWINKGFISRRFLHVLLICQKKEQKRKTRRDSILIFQWSRYDELVEALSSPFNVLLYLKFFRPCSCSLNYRTRTLYQCIKILGELCNCTSTISKSHKKIELGKSFNDLLPHLKKEMIAILLLTDALKER